MTKQRELVYSIVRQSMTHPTASEIFDEAKKQMPSIACGTVYRNLDILVKEKKIRLIEVPNQPNRYDHTLEEHDHVFCERCGKVIDLHLNKRMLDMLAKETGLDVTSYNLIVRYICDDCKRKGEN